MKSIEAEIFQVERRLHLREASIKGETRELKQRTVKALQSPVTIAVALAAGFLVAGGLGRRKARRNAPAVSRETKEQSKGFAVGGLLMTAVTWFIKSQFGGPVGLAQFVVAKIRRTRTGVKPGNGA
jgi:hypothetical protein